MYPINKGFPLICATEVAAKVKDSVVVVQWEIAQEFLQVLKAVADLRWVGFVGFCIGLIKLIYPALLDSSLRSK